MERMDIQLNANHTTSAQLARASSSSGDSQDRRAALIALIQQTRSLSSLPLSAGDELAIAISTWSLAVEEIPDKLLGPSWERAVKDHDWSRSFSPMAIPAAYKALLLDDRQKRQTAQYSARHMDDTVGCRYCGDVGYASIATYCPTGNEWHYPAYACQCPATPVNQRRATPISEGWDRDAYGRWIPTSADVSPQCRCAFCLRGGGR